MTSTRFLAGLALLIPAVLTLDTTTATAATSTNPYTATSGFYVDPDSPAAHWMTTRRDVSTTAVSQIASRPQAKWFAGTTGSVQGNVSQFVGAAAQHNQLPTLVAYNIPQRDCGQFSAGGTTPAQYKAWIRAFGAGIGNRPAVVLLEPDSLFLMPCLSAPDQQTRLSLLRDAVNVLASAAPRTWVYLDGGDGRWAVPTDMAARLRGAGVDKARGFAVNVANYNATSDATANAHQIQTLLSTLGGPRAGYVVDTSRNGTGSNGEWCNPAGRKLGATPQLGGNGADAQLWVKNPGTSDGDCGIGRGTKSGEFTPHLATALTE